MHDLNVTKELKDWHSPRIGALFEGGVDLLAIETLPGQKEAEAIVELLSEEYPSVRTWVSFSCKDGTSVCHGEAFSDAVNYVVKSKNVVAVGINCTAPNFVTSLLKSIQHLNIKKPIIVKPNSGEDWVAHSGWEGRDPAPLFNDSVKGWMANGASWFGGCCRIFPHDIESLKITVRALENGALNLDSSECNL